MVAGNVNRGGGLEKSGFLVGRAREVSAFVPYICGPHQPAAGELALHCQVPQRNHRQPEILSENLRKEEWALGKGRARRIGLADGPERTRERIRYSGAAIRVLEVDIRQEDDRGKGRNAYDILEGDCIWNRVIHTGAAADAGFAVIGEPVREAQARGKIPGSVDHGGRGTARVVIAPAK